MGNFGFCAVHRHVQNCGSAINTPLETIFNQALDKGTFPSEWEKNFIIPVHAKGVSYIIM